jgi:hypothetical protein
VASTPITDAELAELASEFKRMSDEAIARTTYRPGELEELAERYRRLAKLSDSDGQRRAFVSAAARYTREAATRAAVSR